MSRRIVEHVVAIVYALADFVVIMAPALAVRWAAVGDGIDQLGSMDLVAASAVVGSTHAVVAWTRLRSEERTAVRRADIWIASLNALVVLALGATLLLVVVLLGFTDEHAAMANRGYPVVALWVGLQLVAVLLSEAVGRFVFWWLEPHAPTRRLCRWSVLRLRGRTQAATPIVVVGDREPVPAPV